MTLVQVPGMAMTVKYVHVHESQSRPCSSDGGGGWHARPNDGQESFVLTIGPEGEAVDVTSMQCPRASTTRIPRNLAKWFM